jgi:hypothetical protein
MKLTIHKRGEVLASAVQGLAIQTAILVPGGSTCSSGECCCSCSCAVVEEPASL